jgi:serine/threonine protein kinase
MGLTADQQKRCDQIVEQALALDVSVRSAFVTQAFRHDPDLLKEAIALLAIEPHMTAIFQVSPDSAMAPHQFGRYLTEAHIGSGGMSMVYRAHDPVINRAVAVKVMARHIEASPEEYQRFLSELHVLGSLNHPNIVQVFDAGEEDGVPFIVMEYLRGETLADAISQGHCRDFSLKLNVGRQLATALQRVHAATVYHRDVKPANVFLQSDGVVKLMDFGISARLGGQRLTQTGALLGTLPYLAPEQVRGEPLGPSVDIYAFGVLLFELFTGSKPFSGTAADILYKIAHEPIPLTPLSGLPSELVSLIRRATAKDPSARPGNMAEALQCLNRVSDETPAAVRPRAQWLFPLGAAASLVVARSLLDDGP